MEPFFKRLQDSLRAHPPRVPETGGLRLRDASVLAPLFWRDGAPWLLATMRPENLKRHPGQISFPGGGKEAHDVTPLHTALRETEEELGIPRAQVQVLGQLSPLPTITSYYVVPFVGVVPDKLVLAPQASEIAEVLEVPLFALRAEQREFFHAPRDAWVWGDGRHAIWGATWRMLSELLEHVERAK